MIQAFAYFLLFLLFTYLSYDSSDRRVGLPCDISVCRVISHEVFLSSPVDPTAEVSTKSRNCFSASLYCKSALC
jgi:hypothetical protein